MSEKVQLEYIWETRYNSNEISRCLCGRELDNRKFYTIEYNNELYEVCDKCAINYIYWRQGRQCMNNKTFEEFCEDVGKAKELDNSWTAGKLKELHDAIKLCGHLIDKWGKELKEGKQKDYELYWYDEIVGCSSTIFKSNNDKHAIAMASEYAKTYDMKNYQLYELNMNGSHRLIKRCKDSNKF